MPQLRPRTRKSTAKWQVIENVVAALERVRANIPGIEVRQKAPVPFKHDQSKAREVDVLVEIPASGRRLNIGIEVKNHKKPLTTEHMGELADKYRELRLNGFYVISSSGFTEEARDKARRNGIEIRTIEEFTTSPFWIREPGMAFISRESNVLRFALRYSDLHRSLVDNLSRRIASGELSYGDAHIEDSSGRGRLLNILENLAVKAMEQHGADAIDGFEFPMIIDMRNQNGSLVIGGESFPMPDEISADVRCRVRETVMPERRFRLDGVEMVTTELNVLDAANQITIATEPQPDGTRKIIGITMGPANPLKGRR